MVHETAREIPYDAITKVSHDVSTNIAKSRRPSGPILVTHSSGHLWIPAPLNIPSDSLVKALNERCTPSETKRIPHELVDYVAEQQEQFGQDHVWIFESRMPMAGGGQRPCAIAVLTAFAVTGILWSTAAAFGQEFLPWVSGLVMTFLALLLLLAVWIGRKAKQRQTGRIGLAGLVVSPIGIAMVQGDMKGKLLWEEIRNVQLREKSKFFSVGNMGSHIAVDVAGAQIQILDMYDTLLSQINDLMQRHMRPQ
jgi:hypothetical protein